MLALDVGSTTQVAPGEPLPEGSTKRPDRLVGLFLAVALQLGAAVAAMVPGTGRIVALAVPLAALAIAAVLVRDRSSGAYLEFVLWLWFLTPALRRIIDWRAGWDPLNPVMLAAPLASLVCLKAALTGPRRAHRVVVGTFALALAAVGFGLCVGVTKLGPAAPLGALLNWLGPLTLGVYAAFSGPDRATMVRVLERTAVWGCLVLGAYGLVQFFVLPPWDQYWMESAPLFSLGRPEPLEVRVFSTLNSPGPFASVLGCLLILVPATRSWLRWPAAAVGFVGFGLSLVRMAWVGFAVALLNVVVRGRAHGLRTVAVIGVAVVALLSLGGPVKDVVTERFESSVSSGGGDFSLGERVAFHVRVIPTVITDVVGGGLGSSGTATKLSNADAKLGNTADFDGGALELLFTFGIGVGGALLVSIVGAVLAVLRLSRRRAQLDKAITAAVLGLLVQMLFGNTLVSVSGVFFWLLLGLSARLSERASEPEPSVSESAVSGLAH
ncbi:MAG: hypothetical protein AVDCRST_MAG50-619 [uncultured Acidimicrobiales bacterium]|uniref:Uncharacterized protein n=1 Tax=uncultured Acidimicrobiales bacterium TaxID=310071 RepID=A0A6J4HDX0_9ACTN|nr:MAG: hypothetical protein AVDCRST_MAG50-619 [uncultured Acidimicrobiales bacterium]